MDALEIVGELLDELGPKTRSGTTEEVREAFLRALGKLSAEELEEHAQAFEELGAASLASMCRMLALEELPLLH